MPAAWPESAAEAADLAACAERLRAGSKSFAAASRLLPAGVRDAATVLYAFCREADDAVDEAGGGAQAVQALRERLDAIYAATPQPQASDRALARVVARHGLPRTLLDALIEGFEWDVQGRRYATLEALQAYAARVAGTIGAMMAVLMGVRSAEALARACDLGVAMQLTNIARDVGDDARAGRIYLPLDWLAQAGLDVDPWLQAPRDCEPVRASVERLLRAADELYERVAAGVAQLPPACRPGINAARFIYADIGREVRRAGCDSVSRRAVVPAPRKLLLLLRAYLPLGAMQSAAAAPLEATRYLVECSAQAPARALALRGGEGDAGVPWWRVRTRLLWLIDLFERLERRERPALTRTERGELAGP